MDAWARISALLVALISISLLTLSACSGGGSFLAKPGTTTGIITINSAQVYTRERLLNDRYTEADWLRKVLARADQVTFGVQGASDIGTFSGQFSSTKVANKVARAEIPRLGSSNDKELDSGTNAANTDYKELLVSENKQLIPKGNPNLAAVGSSPIDDFRDHLAYREEIRAQLIETQLDDRHDLGGKTLYRLQFSPTVIPGHDTGAWAVLKVRLEQDKLTYDEKRAKQLELYRIWVAYLRRSLQLEFNNTVNAINSGKLTFRNAESLGFLGWDLSKMCKLALEKQKLEYETERENLKIRIESVELIINQINKTSEKKDLQENINKQNILLKEKEKAESYLNQLSNSLENMEKIFKETVGRGEEGSVALSLVSLIDGWAKCEQTVKKLPEEFQNQSAMFSVGVPDGASDKEAKAWVMANLVYRYVTRKAEDIYERFAKISGANDIACLCRGAICEITVNEIVLLNEAKEYNREPKEKKNEEGMAIQNRAVQRIDFDHDRCLSRHIDLVAESPNDWETSPIKEKFDAFTNVFESASSSKTQYVYAVTPKEQVQRVSDTAARRDAAQMQLRLNLLLGHTAGLDTAINNLRDEQLLLHAVRRQPLVVGFTDEGNDAPEFGWVMGPTFQVQKSEAGPLANLFGVGPKTRVQMSFRHINKQNSLAAVIAVPAWWSRIKLTVAGCWLPDGPVAGEDANSTAGQGLGKCMGNLATIIGPVVLGAKEKSQDNNHLKDDGYEKVRILTVDLPTDAADLSRILVPGVARGPRPSINDLKESLVVGRPGRVVIPGFDLWRNTKVTVGTQVADRIIVMPDMQGIVAEFKVVEAPAGWPEVESAREQDVYVWTSEGRAFAGKAQLYQEATVSGHVTVETRPIIFDGGGTIDMTVSSSLLNLNHAAREVSLRPVGATAWRNFVTPDVDVLKERVSLSPSEAGVKNLCTDCKDGTRVEMAFAIQPGPNADRALHKALNRVYLYKSPDAATAKLLTGPGKDAGNPAKETTTRFKRQGALVHMLLPVNAASAFDLRPIGDRIEVAIDGKETVTHNNQTVPSKSLFRASIIDCRTRQSDENMPGWEECTVKVNAVGGIDLDNVIDQGATVNLTFKYVDRERLKISGNLPLEHL